MHLQRGFRMSASYAEQVMRDHGTITWVVRGESIRDTTEAERFEMMAARSRETRASEAKEGILSRAEFPGLHFEPPKNTRYSAPRKEYEEIESPLCVRVCRWPRAA
jgi:hypothetical protein